jgi:hypothetical protein
MLPMHHKANGARSRRAAQSQDIRDEAIVLTFVLALNSEHLTIIDLARSLNADPQDFTRPDAVERAVRDLVGAGLLEIDGGLVKPTVAARRFIQLIENGV